MSDPSTHAFFTKQKRSNFNKFFIATSLLLQLGFFEIVSAALLPIDVTNLGTLKDLYTIKNRGDHYYRFLLLSPVTVSIFLNGLSAGYQIELMDANLGIITSSSNSGTTWTSQTNTGSTGGGIVQQLKAGYFYVHVKPIAISGNPTYKTKDGSFTLNLIPDNAPTTVVVNACEQSIHTHDHHDEDLINNAIASLGNKGGRILLRPGTYHIADNIMVTYDNITIMGTGWKTILKLISHANLNQAGMIRSRFNVDNKNQLKKFFNNQHFSHLALDGNKGENKAFKNGMANFGTYTKSGFDDVRIHDFPLYGIDTYESIDQTVPTSKFVVSQSLLDHNKYDGVVFERTKESAINFSIMDNNGRHGINLVANSNNNTVNDNVISKNGANGITIQTGSNQTRHSNENIIINNLIYSNRQNGVYINLSDKNNIDMNVITHNGRHGIHIRGSYTKIDKNTLIDNSSSDFGIYYGISILSNGDAHATYNEITNNLLQLSAPAMYKFGVAEDMELDDHNSVIANTFKGVMDPIRLKGPNSIEKDNIIS